MKEKKKVSTYLRKILVCLFFLWITYKMISLSLVFCRCFPHSERSEFVWHALDRRGWAHQVRISFREEAPITVTVHYKSSDDLLRHFAGVPDFFESLYGLSITDTTDPRLPHLYVNSDHWQWPPSSFRHRRDLLANERRTLYRQYLVQHELGHCLGKHHPDKGECDDPDLPCKTMCQQSRSECYADPWNHS